MNPAGRKTCRVRPGPDGRKRLKEMLDSGKGSKERRRRAHIPLLADGSRPDGGLGDGGIAEVPGTGTATMERVRRQCVTEGLEAALERKVQVNRRKRLLDGEGEAKPGHAGLFEAAAGPCGMESQTAWRAACGTGDRWRHFQGNGAADLEKNGLKPWLKTCWRIPPKADADFACAMEDVPGACSGEYDGGTVLACMDGTSKRQTKETRAPLPVRPGQPAGYGFECGRNGTANLFMTYAPLDGWRHARVTGRRARQDFARALEDLADARFPGKAVVLVMDNPDTHKLPALYGTFEPAEASRLARRFEVHRTPKRGSWPSMAETGINALPRQCLDRRIPDRETMIGEVAAWQERRNASAKPVNWRFRTEDARIKLKSLYTSIQ